MNQQDTMQRFIFEEADIRGQIVRLNNSFTEILEQHKYPDMVHHLLGEGLVATVLLSALIKYSGQLTLQFQSDGVIKLLLVKCNNHFDIRGLVQYDHEKIAGITEVNQLLGTGKLVVTIEQPKAMNYQSIIPIENNSLSSSLESYFGQSEQLATRIWMAVDKHAAVGMLLQLLPEKTVKDREDFWRYAVQMGETVTDKELLQWDNQTLLTRLYHEDDIRIFETEAVKFKCTCNAKRIENAIKMLGKKEATDILTEKQRIVVTCEFCNKEFTFDRVDVERIFHRKQQ